MTISANGTNIPCCVNVAVSVSTGAATCSSTYLPADQHELVAQYWAYGAFRGPPRAMPGRVFHHHADRPSVVTCWTRPSLSGRAPAK